MKKTILFVDDEKQILRALRRLFHKTEYNIVLSSSGEEALEIMMREKIDMLITDMRMPVMDGHQLLVRTKKEHPNIIRIALSGYTDKQIVLSALEKNLAKIYLFKPWNNEEIIAVIDRLFEFEELLRGKNLLDLINNLSDLPTVPRLYTEVSEMVQEELPVSEIADCIEKDPAIASRVLRIANSAYYGSKTGDIKQAIMFIGLTNVKNIILSYSVFQVKGKNREQIECEWTHASLTNKIMNSIYSKLLKKRIANEYKSAGLLHNIGRGILINNVAGIYETTTNGHLSTPQYEIEKIGVSHQQIGSYVLNWWELPLPILECAMFHHNPMDKAICNKEIVQVIHIAQYYAWIILGKEPEDDLSAEVLSTLKISQTAIENLIEEIKT